MYPRQACTLWPRTTCSLHVTPQQALHHTYRATQTNFSSAVGSQSICHSAQCLHLSIHHKSQRLFRDMPDKPASGGACCLSSRHTTTPGYTFKGAATRVDSYASDDGALSPSKQCRHVIILMPWPLDVAGSVCSQSTRCTKDTTQQQALAALHSSQTAQGAMHEFQLTYFNGAGC